jgi:hypothetical protein
MATENSDGQAETRPAQPDRIEKKGGYSPSKVTDLAEVSNPQSGPAPGSAPKTESSNEAAAKQDS